MTYQDQLDDSRWIAKRKTILNRDHNSCRHCNDEAIFEKSQSGQPIKLECLDDFVTALLNASDPRFRPNTPKHKINYKDRGGKTRSSIVFLNGWLSNSELEKKLGHRVHYAFRADLPYQYDDISEDKVIVTVLLIPTTSSILHSLGICIFITNIIRTVCLLGNIQTMP